MRDAVHTAKQKTRRFAGLFVCCCGLELGSWNNVDVNGSGMHAASAGGDDGCQYSLIDCTVGGGQGDYIRTVGESAGRVRSGDSGGQTGNPDAHLVECVGVNKQLDGGLSRGHCVVVIVRNYAEVRKAGSGSGTAWRSYHAVH